MQKKEVLIVVLSAVVLSNLAIVGTLLAKGYFDSDDPEPIDVVEADSREESEVPQEEGADPEADPNAVKPSPANYVRRMSEAMDICEEKFLAATASIHKSYEFKHSESLFSEEEELYRVFIEYETIWQPDSPVRASSVVCEVSAPKRMIVGYKVLPL